MSGSKNSNPPIEPLERVFLGAGLELWRVNVNMPVEQSVNARVMSPDAFNQLAETIKRDSRLESMPLCALNVQDNKLETVSGHHRIRAAKKAGVLELWVIVDVSGLTRDQIRAKQLAHNSIQGMDDSELVAKIFQSIEDAEAKIEAFIDVENVLKKVPLVLETKNLEVEFEGRTATVLFLPSQMEVWKKALNLLVQIAETDEAFIATRDEYETLISAINCTSATFQINSVPTILAKMAEIVIAHCEAAEAGDGT